MSGSLRYLARCTEYMEMKEAGLRARGWDGSRVAAAVGAPLY